MTAFELSTVGGPWASRFGARRGWIDALPWSETGAQDRDLPLAEARLVWTRTAFSEYASAAAFAEISTAMLAAGAPIDLVAAAADFVVDELHHAEVAARIALALGGAVPMEVDLERLVRPPAPGRDALVRCAELVLRTCCIGETLTVPMLKVSRASCASPLIEAALRQILGDESQHAQLGWWFLDWAADRFSDSARDHLGGVASRTIESFAPVFGGPCTRSGLGVVACADYDAAFFEALDHHVVAPLAERGIEANASAIAMLRARVGPA